jgi:hypothetical protein
MDRSSDHSNLVTALAKARPTPREDFAKELDERVAAGFPRRSHSGETRLGDLLDYIRDLSPQRLLLSSGTAALAVIAIATVIVAGNETGRPQPISEQAPNGGLLSEFSGSSESTEPQPRPSKSPAKVSSGGGAIHAPSAPAVAGSAASGGSGETELQYAPAPVSPPRSAAPASAANGAAETGGRAHREIERSAEIGLLADPSDVADDSAAVFAAVHDAHGIVLHSTTASGKRAGANFDLLIPSAQLGDALAAFSAIDEVGSRHEATEDITAPTVSASEKLRDSRARIDGLLAQLAAAETETEMSVIEAELARERHHATSLRAQLDKLEQRTDFSRVSVRIETSGSSTDSGGAWGIGDAFDDAGHILGIAAGVTLIGLAVLAPLALIALLAWLAHRTWVRTQRQRALRNS